MFASIPALRGFRAPRVSRTASRTPAQMVARYDAAKAKLREMNEYGAVPQRVCDAIMDEESDARNAILDLIRDRSGGRSRGGIVAGRLFVDFADMPEEDGLLANHLDMDARDLVVVE